MEKIIKPMSGFFMLFVALLLLGGAVWFFAQAGQQDNNNPVNALYGALIMVAFIFVVKGVMIVNPNHSRVLVFFGKYVGSVKDNGLLWVNPFYKSYRIS